MSGNPLFDRRIVLVTGKGGVGRSSVTGALALAAAKAGKRVLLTEIGEPGKGYSAVGRWFGRENWTEEPEPLAPGIHGCYLYMRAGHEDFLASVLPSELLAKAAIRSRALRRFLDAAPSFAEMGVFQHLLKLIKKTRRDGSPQHELIFVDMPATGHTLGLTGLPEILLKLITSGPMARNLREGQSYMNDPARSCACVVTLPETLPVTECLELIEGLKETRVHVGAVVLNRFPIDPFTPREREALVPMIQQYPLYGAGGLKQIDASRKSIQRLRANLSAPLYTTPEFRFHGLELLNAIAGNLTRESA
ncbi:MAG: hypothetical protein GMKNLPBB_01251 [Myxococcota bacterium]|nr:hypothetical protein [Myxococcota bacterium]